MKSQRIVTVGCLGLVWMVLAACAPQAGGVPATETSPGSPGLPPEAVLNAQQWLAEQLSVTAERVQIVEIEQAEWSDSCLGLGSPEEMCAQVITPGWKAVFEVDGKRYEVRTDETGSAIRLAEPA